MSSDAGHLTRRAKHRQNCIVPNQAMDALDQAGHGSSKPPWILAPKRRNIFAKDDLAARRLDAVHGAAAGAQIVEDARHSSSSR